MSRKKILVLGACGNIGPYITPGLESDYDLVLSDVVPHPDGREVLTLDITSYEQVLEASRGMDAIVNFAVVRDSPTLSFHVNTRGTYHIMEAARELGITKVVNTAAQSARYWFDHDFDVDTVPEWPGTGYYMCTKYLGQELSRIYARTYGIQDDLLPLQRTGSESHPSGSGPGLPPLHRRLGGHAARLPFGPGDRLSPRQLPVLQHAELSGAGKIQYRQSPAFTRLRAPGAVGRLLPESHLRERRDARRDLTTQITPDRLPAEARGSTATGGRGPSTN